MRRTIHALALLTLAVPIAITAQERPRLEIGTSAAIGRVSGSGDESLTYASIPGGSWVEGANLYVGFFPSEKLIVEPEASLRWLSVEDQGFTLLGLTGRVKYLFKDAGQGSPYLAGQVGLIVERDNNPEPEEDDTDTGYSLGAGLGYRTMLGRSVAFSVEARYRRWMGDDYFGDDPLNEIGVVLAIGAVVPR